MGEVSSPEISGGPLRSYNVGVAPLDSADITGLLKAWGRGDQAALEQLTPLVYGELRAQARRYMRNERSGVTLQSTALVHEVYLKLKKQKNPAFENRSHFFAIAARLMREVLIDYARTKNRAKRGGEQEKVGLEGLTLAIGTTSFDLVALDQALTRLAAKEEHLARIVELRFFSGLSVEETAEVLKVSDSTVKRDWQMAKAWLHRELSR